MLVTAQLEKHSRTYFIFGTFAYMFFFIFYHLCHDDVGTYICSHV